ncbi:MAG: hypothetical protein U5K75_00300 [Ahrensia sp.]|nr:hypothetical protein [Ahrensia sp.]
MIITFLDPIEHKKAAVENPKLIRGEVTGSVIEISMGPSNVPFWRAQSQTDVKDAVIVCEGIETGLSLAIAAPEARVWAGGSITNLANVPVHFAVYFSK